MLDLSMFDVLGSVLFYESERHYFISKDDCGYVLRIETLDDNFDISVESYACSSLSVAVASIEALENGEEI